MSDDGRITLKLEGKLLQPWVDELHRTWTEHALPGAPPSLDLAHVTFVDADGAGLLTELLRRGAVIVSRSNFVAELLDGVRS